MQRQCGAGDNPRAEEQENNGAEKRFHVCGVSKAAAKLQTGWAFWSALFIGRFARFLPLIKTLVHVEHVFEIERFDLFAGAAAAPTGRAMDDVSLRFVERGNTLREIFVVKIDVGRAFDVAGFEFARRADVEDDDVCVRFDQLRGFIDADVFRVGSVRNVNEIKD